MTAEQIEELERLLAAATPGLWEHSERSWVTAEPWSEKLKPGAAMVCCTNVNDPRREANATLIAAMRNALPGLLALAKRALAETPSAQPGPQAADPERVVADLDASIPHPAPQ